MNEIIITAATVEEAMAEARKKYSSSDTDLSFDILQMPKKGFLGIGAQPAKVKVTVSKSLPDVDLSSLVSDIRNMKIDEPEEKPKQNPQKQNQQKQSQQKPGQKQNPQQKPQQQSQPKPQQQSQPKPQQKQNPPAPQPKTEQKPKPQPAVKPAEAKTAPAEDSIPVALRKPAERREPPKKQDKKPKQQRPADNRPADEKKKDLLSAVMGVKEEKKAAADFHTVTESTSPKADTRWERFTDAVEEKWEAVEDKLEAVGDRAEEIADSIEDKLEAAIGRLTGGSDDEPAKKEDTRRMEFVTPEEMQYALDFANTLFANMNLPAKAVHNPDARGEEIPEGTVAARIDIVGDDSGILIGHHGETLDAIQYLVNLCASRKSESAKREFVKIVVDIEGYRGKREETLRSLARRMAAKAVKYKRNVVLEPMNPYERRIIHSEVQGIENVSTHSVGSDENRKIVITYEGSDKAPKKGGRNDRRRKKSGENRDAARAEKPAREEKTEKAEKTDRSDRPRVKPVRAKSIDDIRLDLSEESSVTLGSIGTDTEDTEEVVETRIREY